MHAFIPEIYTCMQFIYIYIYVCVCVCVCVCSWIYLLSIQIDLSIYLSIFMNTCTVWVHDKDASWYDIAFDSH